MAEGYIFDIQRFCYQDGPGIRTVVFFKGCPLRCRWCHNPESWVEKSQLMFDREKCLLCGHCVDQCEHQVFDIYQKQLSFHPSLCDGCGKCISACSGGALRVCGRNTSDDELYAEIIKDLDFYRQSGGGITLSGGEALAQPELALALLIRCKDGGIHTAIETCGYNPWDTYQSVLSFCDLFLYDIKAFSPEAHLQWTGIDNTLILENFKKLKKAGAEIIVRIPIIPTVNDGEEFDKMLAFLRESGQQKLTLIPYHRLWQNKFTQLYGQEPVVDFPVLAKDEFEWYKNKAARDGFLLLD